MNIWRLMAHHQPEHYDEVIRWSRVNGTIAIGWGRVGDLNERCPQNERHLSTLVKEAYRQWNDNGVYGGRSLWRLHNDIQIGDLVILNTKRRQLTMQVTGDYYYADDDFPYDYRHRRKAQSLPINPDWLWKRSGGMAPGENVFWTLFRCENTISEAELKELLVDRVCD